MRIVLATYNVHQCVGIDRRRSPERILEVLRELDADVIALQELQWHARDSLHLLAEFARELGCEAVPGPTLMRANGHYGNALLTRVPVLEHSDLDLSVPGREPRGAIDARLRTRDGSLRLLATHLGLAPAERREQAYRLVSRIAKPSDRSDAATVLLGDLNEWFRWGRPLRWLERHFGSGRANAPASYPARRPIFALDRVWVRPHPLLHEVRAHASPRARIASDHLPVRAVIELQAS